MSTALALVATLAVMVVWNIYAHVGRGHLLPIAGPLSAALLLLLGRLAGLSWSELGFGAGSLIRGLVWGGVLMGAGTWLVLKPRSFEVIIGFTLLSYGVNLFIFFMGRITDGKPPILTPGTDPTLLEYVDPLPQALVLTAIVISFGMTALLLALALRARALQGSDYVDGADAGEGDRSA